MKNTVSKIIKCNVQDESQRQKWCFGRKWNMYNEQWYFSVQMPVYASGYCDPMQNSYFLPSVVFSQARCVSVVASSWCACDTIFFKYLLWFSLHMVVEYECFKNCVCVLLVWACTENSVLWDSSMYALGHACFTIET